MLIRRAVVWMWMCATAKRTSFTLRSVLHPHPPRSTPSVCPWWHAGTLAVWVWVRDGDTNSRLRIAPVSAGFFPRLPAVCCSFLGTQAICAMVTVPACQLRHRFHLSSASLPAWWLSSSCRASSLHPPQPQWYTMLIRQSNVLSFSPSSWPDFKTG